MVERDIDVLILGATVAGFVAARDLATAGRRVTLLDVAPEGTCPLPSGAASAAIGSLGHEIALHAGEERAVTYLAGLDLASQEIAGFAREHGVGHEEVPGWSVAVDGHLAFQLRQESRLLRLAGIPVDFSDRQPFAHDIRPTLAIAGQVVVDPVAYISALRASGQEAGVEIVRTPVRRILPDGVVADAREFHAGAVLDTVGVVGGRAAPATGLLLTVSRPVLVAPPQAWPAGEGGPGPVLSVSSWFDTPAEQVIATSESVMVIGRPGGDVASLGSWAREFLGDDATLTRTVATEEGPDGLPMIGPVSPRRPLWVARGFGLAALPGGTWGGHRVAAAILEGVRRPGGLRYVAGSVAAEFRTRFGPLADPKQRVSDVLAARGLSRRVSDRG